MKYKLKESVYAVLQEYISVIFQFFAVQGGNIRIFVRLVQQIVFIFAELVERQKLTLVNADFMEQAGEIGGIFQ